MAGGIDRECCRPASEAGRWYQSLEARLVTLHRMSHPSGRPWIIAHRGASLQAQENTIAAFELAADLGADAVELDARRTADGVLVVHHDDTVTGLDRPIVAMNRAELAATAPWIPDLGEALTACADMWIDVEVKNDPRDADWDPDDAVMRTIVTDYGTADIVITSFNTQTVAVASRAGLRTGWLIGRKVDPVEATVTAAEAGHEFLLPHFSTLRGRRGKHIVAAAAGAGIELAVWTVDEPTDIVRLADLGVGGIATNAPDIARAALAP